MDDLLCQTQTNTVYNIPSHLMEGVEGKEFLINNIRDEEEVARVVKEATTEVLSRTGGAGFPLLCNDDTFGLRISAVNRGVESATVGIFTRQDSSV